MDQISAFFQLTARNEHLDKGRRLAGVGMRLPKLQDNGRFAPDEAFMWRMSVYFRLVVIELTIPPLRERRENILMLAHQFLRELAGHEPLAIDDNAHGLLRCHQWPGNIRELRNRTERAVALRDSDLLTERDVFPEKTTPSEAPREDTNRALDVVAETAIRRRVQQTLAAAGGNQSEAARLLGVSRTTIWKYTRDV